MQALYVALPTLLSLGLKDITIAISWSLPSDSDLLDQIAYQFYEMIVKQSLCNYLLHSMQQKANSEVQTSWGRKIPANTK